METTGLPMVWSHNEYKVIWCVIGQQTFCHKVGSFLGFFGLIFAEEEEWPIQVVVLLDPSLFTGNEIEDGNAAFPVKRKWQYSRIEFCMNLAQLFILSYLTTPWKMFPFESTRALFYFISTIDENTNTVI